MTSVGRGISGEIWAVSNATLVDGTGAVPRPATTVIIERGKLVWVGPDEVAPNVPDHQALNVHGACLLPGLVNAHVHLCNDGADDLAAQISHDTVPIATVRAIANARASLDHGITTVRDCGAAHGTVIDVAAAIGAGLAEGPRVVAAGRVLTMTGGHGHYMGVEVDGADAARRAVRRELQLGADFIKTMATGGVLTKGRHPSQIALCEDELVWIVREAHAAGRRVSAHAIGRQGIANALAAGVDSLEHGFYLDEELFEIAIDRGTFLVPTLVALDGILDENATPPNWIAEKAMEQRERSREMFRAAVSSGIRIAAGTDAGTPYNPHTALVTEIVAMARLGMPALAAIQTATLAAAQNLDIDREVGSVEVGKTADLALFDAGAVSDLSRLARPLMVVQAGTVVRDTLPSHPSGIGFHVKSSRNDAATSAS